MTTAAPTLAERKAATFSELAELERAQAVAILDGQAFDARRLVEVRQELEALDGAETELVRRERVAQAAGRAEERAEARKALAGSLDAYLVAVGRAESAAAEMVSAFQELEATAEAMRARCRVIGGAMLPIPLEQHEARSKHSAMLATKLRRLTGQNRFGCLEWNSVVPIPDWSAHARKTVGGALKPFIEGE